MSLAQIFFSLIVPRIHAQFVFLWTNKVAIKKIISDKEGRFLIFEVEIAGEKFVFINLYNPNTESKQIKTFEKLFSNMKLLNLDECSQIACTGNLNFFFSYQLQPDGGNPPFKSKSVSKFYEINETLDLCDIWRVRNRNKKRFTFHQKHFSGFIRRRLDYIFISNNLKESVVKAEVLESFLGDHLSVIIKICLSKELRWGSGLWKINNSLLQDENFVKRLRKYIKECKTQNTENVVDEQMKWDFIKNEIRKLFIAFFKSLQRKKRKKSIIYKIR